MTALIITYRGRTPAEEVATALREHLDGLVHDIKVEIIDDIEKIEGSWAG